MKNKIKQLLSVAMTVCMLSTVVPLNAYAADVDFGDSTSVTAETDSDVTESAVTSDASDTDVELTSDGDDTDVVEEEETEKPDATEGDNTDVVVEEETEEPDATEGDNTGEEELFTAEEETDVFSDGVGAIDLESLYTISGNGNKATAAMDTFYKICFVDCGRKYFSVNSLKQIIDNASKAGFNYIELAVGNDGLRFLLDDMSLTVGSMTYESDAVKTAIHNGNTAYNATFDTASNGYYYPYSTATNELTESDMNEVIIYARKKGMGVIPLLNSPGHMDSILDAAEKLTGETCSYNNSARTIDLTNPTAVAFTQAIIQKYITYFASKGCTAFNMGADEYANDVSSSENGMGFGSLQNKHKYSYYIKYINKIADMIKGAGMWPMAFNDGIYFNNVTSSGTVDTDILVCYWSGGWSGYTPASASFLKNDKGFKLINTNGDYYWVLGKTDCQPTASKTGQFNKNKFSGNSTIDSPQGAMFCIWSDYPGAETEASVISKTASAISGFGSTLPQSKNPEINTAYNVDGAGDGFVVGQTATLTLSEGSNIVKYESSNSDVIELTGNTDSVSAEVAVAAEEPTSEGVYTSVTATAKKPGTVIVTLTSESGRELTTELTVEPDETHPLEKDITVAVGAAKTETLTGDLSGSYTTENPNIATVSATVENVKEENIPYSAKASASIDAYTDENKGITYNASNMIDGSTDTKYWSKSEQTVGAYVQVDLGAAIPFDTVRLTSCESDYCTNAEVSVSADGSAWEALGSYTGSTKPTSFTNTLSKARYIKVEIKEASAYWWQLAEIEWGNTTDGAFTRMLASGTVTTEASTQTKLTFTGVSVGDTSVQIGTTKYNIHVVAEDISNVTPVKAEYWITNRQVTANNAKYKEINATDPGVYSENGAEFRTLVPQTGKYGNGNDDNMVFYKGTLLNEDNKQTEDKGVNRINSGTNFTYIRYLGGKWQVSADRKNWTDIATTDQIVAYYLQKTDVTNEVATAVVDWGVTPYSDYNSSNFVLLDYAVKYQTGDRTPDSFPVSGKTVAFHCDPGDTTSVHQYNGGEKTIWSNNDRDIGLIRATETSDYEIYMITVTASSDDRTTPLVNYRDDSGNIPSNVTSYAYNGTEKVIWVDDEANLGYFTDKSLHASGYHVGGEATVPGLTITNRHAMLVTYYVRAKVSADSLQVRYVDKTSNTVFYDYNIRVKSGTTFRKDIALPEGHKGDLVNGDVVNSLDKTQHVSSDLSTMPEIGASYRYSDYTCEELKLSEDQKVLTIYYTFNNTHSFVADYGLPLLITAGDLGIQNPTWKSSSASTMRYGTVKLDPYKHTLTYTPTSVLPEAETINLTLEEYADAEHTRTTKRTLIIYIYPATTVNYEEGFAAYTGSWSGGSTGAENQKLALLGKDTNNYGYDAQYASASAESNGTQAVSKTKGDSASFSFTGTGTDIYANTTKSSGDLTIKISDQSGKTVKLALVDTKMSGEYKGSEDGYSVPVFSATDLTHDNYKVTIIHSVNNSQVNIDGFRVYNTLADSTVYTNDEEDNPSFLEVRDLQFGTLTNIANYGKDGRTVYAVGEQVYKDITADVQKAHAAIIVDGKPTDEAAQKALYEKGPKNEVYLAPNSVLTFNVNTSRKVQLGLKGVNGRTSYSLNTGDSTGVSTVDMFYTVKEKGSSDNQTIAIKNTGENILSVTKLKVCDDPNALQPLSVDSVVSALYAAGLKDPEQPTATPTPTVTATAAPTQKPVQQIKLATPKLGKVVSAGYNALKLNWSKVNGANGYRVYVKVNGQWKALGNTKSTTYVHKKLETGKSYTYTVKAYKNTKSGTVWSSYDKKGITGKAALSAPSLRKAKRTSAKKATLSWKKVNGASGYVVYRKTNNGRWQIVKKITKGNITSFTDKKLSKGKKYTYTVRAYRTVGKKNIYSGYNKKGLKVK